ncbi:Ascorbate utilization transcriptional regulator UlaR [Salmonella enterica subsp. enterica serovar Montevideo str. S5-403]|uniref:Ascorbate utilization transcriptional regulator UlaR n=5 Tax=Salmonella enterica TaxID=28901 RepID=G5QBY6_SALMO|nr:Ascorbate utilization transcriptional regulator UlaR [Salmonella enterica subsp. enterica serovar Montevideo str. S5-403]
MTEAQRHQILLDMLAQLGFVTVENVIERLGISPATARRDINKLDESGKLKKVRNGAEAITQQRPRWTPMNLHQAQNHDEKVRIAKAASQLVNPGESVVINCGSTAFLLGREMCGKPVQIITNYLPLANYLIDQEHDSVIIMGGQYNKSQSITLSPQGSENSLYAGHWMFTSGKGLTADGLYKTDMLTAMAEHKTDMLTAMAAMAEQKMLSVVGKLVALVDSSKIGERAGMLFSRADQIAMLITGKNANPQVLQQLEAQGVSILRV